MISDEIDLFLIGCDRTQILSSFRTSFASILPAKGILSVGWSYRILIFIIYICQKIW
ncbi:hypothetical protein ACEYW6_18350 [Nostoc sp. UIC 10607]